MATITLTYTEVFLFFVFMMIVDVMFGDYLENLGEKAADKVWSFCTKN